MIEMEKFNTYIFVVLVMLASCGKTSDSKEQSSNRYTVIEWNDESAGIPYKVKDNNSGNVFEVYLLTDEEKKILGEHQCSCNTDECRNKRIYRCIWSSIRNRCEWYRTKIVC